MERLQAKGWIARTSSETDRRIKIVDITGEGKKLLKQVEPLVAQAQARMLAPLSSDEQATLMVLLSKLVHLNNDSSRAPQRLPEA